MKIKLSKKKKVKKVQKPRRTSPAPTPIVDAVVTPPPVPTEMKPRTPRVISFKTPDKHRSNLEWAFEEAIKRVGCVRCDAEPGGPCVGKRDRPIGTIHIARLSAYRKDVGAEDYQQRHGGATLIGKLLGGDL